MNENKSSLEQLVQQFLEQNQAHVDKNKKQNPKEVLHKLAVEGRNLYHDRNGNTYIEVIDKNKSAAGATYLIPIESSEFDRWLISEAHKTHKLYLDNQNLLKTIKVLVSVKALKDGTPTEIHNRIATENGAIYIDIGGKDRKAIRIDKHGWRVGNYKVFFNRHIDMAELPLPEQGGRIQDIVEFMPPMPKRDQCLAISWLVASFFSEIERAFLLVEGENGTGKTTLTKLLKSFIDPAHGGALTYSDNVNNVAQLLDHHCLPLIDNVTKISPRVSDIFCTAYSGAAHTLRKQYTDDEDFIFNLTGNVIFTTVHMTKPKSDFLNRCYKIETKMTTQTYRSKLQHEKKFEAVKEKLFGAVLDCVVKTMAEVEKSQPVTKFRTVDFDHYAACAAEVMGYGKELFWEARHHCEMIKKKSITNSTPLIQALSNYLKSNGNRYVGPVGKLLQQLPKDLQVRSEIPNQPNVFARKLNELKPELSAAGIIATRLPNGNSGSVWEIVLRVNDQNDSGEEAVPVEEPSQPKPPIDDGAACNEPFPDEAIPQAEDPFAGKNPFLLNDDEINSLHQSDTAGQDSESTSEVERLIRGMIKK